MHRPANPTRFSLLILLVALVAPVAPVASQTDCPALIKAENEARGAYMKAEAQHRAALNRKRDAERKLAQLDAALKTSATRLAKAESDVAKARADKAACDQAAASGTTVSGVNCAKAGATLQKTEKALAEERKRQSKIQSDIADWQARLARHTAEYDAARATLDTAQAAWESARAAAAGCMKKK